MRLPVTCIQICILDGITTVDHHPVPHINATVGHARRVIGADKEHQVARLGVGDRRGDVIEPLGAQPPGVAQAGIGQHIRPAARCCTGRYWSAHS